MPYIDCQIILVKGTVKVDHQTCSAVGTEEMVFFLRVELVLSDVRQGISVPLDLVARRVDEEVAVASTDGAITVHDLMAIVKGW